MFQGNFKCLTIIKIIIFLKNIYIENDLGHFLITSVFVKCG